MNTIRSILNPLSGIFPLSSMIRMSGQNLFLPFYHGIQGDYSLPHIQHLYPPKTKLAFEIELDFMLKYFRPISLFDVQQHILNQNPIKKTSFHLSFDDGLRSSFDVIMPILERKGIPATFFLNSDFIDNKDLFYRYKVSLLIEAIKDSSPKMVKQLLDYRHGDIPKINQLAQNYGIDFTHFLEREKPYLTSAQIEILIQKGFTIGAHSQNHPHYADLSLENQISQTKKSVDFIQKRFGLDYRIFSFPFTDFGVKESFFKKVFDENIVDMTFSSAGIKKDSQIQHLHRTPMENHNQSGKSILKTEYLYYLLKQPFGKNMAKR